MFGISFEHIVILGIILLIVGPRRLPELGNTMGKAIKNFKDSFSGVEEASFKRVNENASSQPVATKTAIEPNLAETVNQAPVHQSANTQSNDPRA